MTWEQCHPETGDWKLDTDTHQIERMKRCECPGKVDSGISVTYDHLGGCIYLHHWRLAAGNWRLTGRRRSSLHKCNSLLILLLLTTATTLLLLLQFCFSFCFSAALARWARSSRHVLPLFNHCTSLASSVTTCSTPPPPPPSPPLTTLSAYYPAFVSFLCYLCLLLLQLTTRPSHHLCWRSVALQSRS